MDVQKQIDYWRLGSDDDWSSAERLFASGHDFHWALFIMHLSVEKALKALVVKRTEQQPARIHNLLRLAELAELSLETSQAQLFYEASQFNLHARYPEEQAELMSLATKVWTEKYLRALGEARQWILSQI